jgi:hypothetical protein
MATPSLGFLTCSVELHNTDVMAPPSLAQQQMSSPQRWALEGHPWQEDWIFVSQVEPTPESLLAAVST